MMGPLVVTGGLSASANLYTAVGIGLLFGLTLQRLGFTHATKIARAFYMRDVDVPVGMFSAIATGMLGLWGLALLGLIDISKVYFLPTYLAPMATGGLIFGLGMVIGGYCPGTAAASMFTGKVDALVFMVGFFAGTLLFGDLFPVWGDFYRSDYRGVFRVDQLLHISLGLAILGVTVVSLAGICLFRRLQRHFWGLEVVCAMSAAEKMPAILALLIALPMAFFPTTSFFAIEKTAGAVGGWDRPLPNPGERVYLGPLEVGRLLYDYADRSKCLDLRSARRFAESHLPGALNAAVGRLYTMRLPEGTVALVYGGDPQQSRKALEVLWQQRGVRAYVAESDYAELKRLYLDPLPGDALRRLSAQEQAELRTYRAFFQRSAAAPQGERPAPGSPAPPQP